MESKGTDEQAPAATPRLRGPVLASNSTPSPEANIPLIMQRKPRTDEDPDMQPVSTMTAWMKDLLEQKNKHGVRKISPRTAKRAQSLLNHCAATGGNVEERDSPHGQANIRLLHSVKTEMERRLDTDAKYASCRVRLDEALEEGFYLRYGDYYTVSLSELRRHTKDAKASCKKAQKQGNKEGTAAPALPSATTTALTPKASAEAVIETFLKEPWNTIEGKLDEEVGGEEKPMTELLTKLAELADVDFPYIRATIQLYTTPNRIAHAKLSSVAKAGRAFELASKILADMVDLKKKYEHIISNERLDATRNAILQAAKCFFETFELHPDGSVYWYKPWSLSADGKIERGDKSTST
ncbi:hypothetical protein F4677DRAFT_464481 [Hypoxylon crocopeplum]|nr:hypothetical protein F4677DRAFT_464481 [Hypoxylon crocopeplum]